MLTTAAVQPILTVAFQRVLQHLQGAQAQPDDALPEAIRAYFRLKAEKGRAEIAEALGLHEQELAPLEAAARDVERTLQALAQDASATHERNAVLAQVRLLSWMETCDRHVPLTLIEGDLEALVSADVGHKQVRALELIVRSLITESYQDQDKLIARLRQALSERAVEKWEAKADPGDILSGMTFSELASLFVNKSEFERYEKIYEDTPFLTLLKQRRRTIQAFLDDVRRIRNTLAHNKRVTNTQLTLLDLYYEEIVEPVQTAFDQGETRVDPATFLEVRASDLQAYVDDLHEDVNAVRDDMAEFRASVEGKLGAIAKDTTAIKERTEGIDKKLIGIGVGVAALLVAAFFLLKGDEKTQEAVETAREASERTEDAAKASKEAAERTEDVARKSADRVEEAASDVKRTAEETREAADAAKDAAEETKDIAKETKDVVDETKEAVKDTKEAADAAKGAAKEAAAATERVAESLDALKKGFEALTKEGGIIVDANRASAHYHNARIYEQRGDTAKAMQSYRQYFSFPDQGFVDPHLRYQQLLKLQQGLGGAREIYHAMKETSKSPVTAFAWMLSLPRDARIQNLTTYTQEHPKFAPAHYMLSRDFSLARLGSQTLDDKRSEKEHLEAFLALQEDAAFLKHYLDQTVAGKQVDDAKQRLAALNAVADTVMKNPVSFSASKSNQGWIVSFVIAEMTKEIFWRTSEGTYKSTGHLPNMHPATGLPMPRPFVTMPLTTGKTVIQVKYVDPKGKEHGPYDLAFDPDIEVVKSVKSTLEITKSSWVTFGRGNGLLYFSGLLSWRGAFKEIRYGLNKDVPDAVFPFSTPDPKDPHAIKSGDTIYIPVAKSVTYVTVQITFKDGTKSEVNRIDR